MVKARDTWTWWDIFWCFGIFKGHFLWVFFSYEKIVIAIQRNKIEYIIICFFSVDKNPRYSEKCDGPSTTWYPFCWVAKILQSWVHRAGEKPPDV